MSRLKHKLFHLEQEPPASTWNKIRTELDEADELKNLAAKLYHTATPPPPFSWKKIIDQLDQEMPVQQEESTLAPVRKMNPLWRYVAAAMLIGAVAWGIIRFTTQPVAGEVELANAEITQPSQPTAEASIIPLPDQSKEINQNNQITSSGPSANQDNAVASVTKAFQNTNSGFKKRPEAATRTIAYNKIAPSTKKSNKKTAVAERYIVLKNSEGEYVRLSKKWEDLVCCVSGEEQDENCKTQLENWQEKLANIDISTSGNFIDILNIMNSLD